MENRTCVLALFWVFGFWVLGFGWVGGLGGGGIITNQSPATLLDPLLHLKHALDATLLDPLLHLKHALDATLLDLLLHLKHALDATLLDPLLHLKHALDATLLWLWSSLVENQKSGVGFDRLHILFQRIIRFQLETNGWFTKFEFFGCNYFCSQDGVM